MHSKWTRVAKRGTLHCNETWEGDRRRTTVQLAAPGEEPVTPDLVLWADSDHGVVVGQQVVLPDAPAHVMADTLRRAIDHPAPGGGPPRQPRCIRVNRQEIAEAVRPVTEPLGIRVEVTDTLPLADDVFRSFEVQFGSPADQGYLDASEVPEAALADLFEAAAAFYKARPWKGLTDGDPVLLECADWTPPYRYAVVLGAGGSVKGVAIYESLKHLERLALLPPDDPRSEEAVAGIPVLALLFTALKELGQRRAEEVTRHGWKIASRNAYPLIVGTGRGRESQWPTPGEVRTLTAALRMLPSYAKVLSRQRWLAEGQQMLTQSYTVKVGDEERHVTATFPPPHRSLR
ncbi:MAG TPA: hypothetical protein GX715_13290 [Armatimonadetes bacterium]|jgi:hypothetical protein|nr:hypothetical protein [Armatimonadota bacterium]